jgi:hypothetical protein
VAKNSVAAAAEKASSLHHVQYQPVGGGVEHVAVHRGEVAVVAHPGGAVVVGGLEREDVVDGANLLDTPLGRRKP